MASEGERPKSSWQSWVRGAERRRSDPEPAARPETADDDPEGWTSAEGWAEEPAEDTGSLDVKLQWSTDDGPEVSASAVDGPVDDEDVWDDVDEEDEGADEDAVVAEIDDEDDDDEGVDDDDDDDDELGFGADDDDFGELVPVVPLLPSIAGRVEALSGVLRSISHSVDGLTATTDVYRAATVDRIDEFTETVLEQGRRSDQSLEEYRRTTERAITELRRRLAEQGDTAAKLLGRVEEVATDVGSLVNAAGVAPAAGAAAAPAAEPAVAVDLSGLEGAVGNLEASVAVIIDQLAAMERLLGELPVPEAAPAPADVDLSPLLARLGDVHALVEVIVDTMPGSAVGSGADVVGALEELKAAVAKPTPARAAKAQAIDEAAVAAIAEAVVARLDLDALAALVAEHLTSTFEVVSDAPEPAKGRGRRK